MDQQRFQLKPVVPTGEASYRYDPAETDEGVYFAIGYRGKRVCIDSGLLHIMEQFKGWPTNGSLHDAADYVISNFLKDYPKVWWKNQRTGEILEVVKITTSCIRTAPAGEPFTPRQLTTMTLILSPHYKVPNDQSMGSAPVHII